MELVSIKLLVHAVELDAAAVFLIEGFFICPMGNSDDGKKISTTLGMDNLSLSISANKFSRDLLQRFKGSVGESDEMREEDEGIELTLGLSLGGRFGVDKSSNTLKRSSSIASCLPVVKDDNSDAVAPAKAAAYTGLVRTSSLPLEAEEEWRKRKEWQTLRRMEAKRRRSEKQRILKGEKGGEGHDGSRSLSLEVRKETEENLRWRLERERYLPSLKRPGSVIESRCRMDGIVVKGKGRCVGTDGKHGIGNLASQVSFELKGGSPSSVPDIGSKTPPGSSSEASPSDVQSLQERSNPDSTYSGSKSRENKNSTQGSKSGSPSKRLTTSITHRETTANPLEDMPCVFTKGDGPNGRRVDGILYKYGKGQEVRIMCICHGTFHSPAEFIKHAGGTDVDHPLKHIVINRNASSLL